MLISELAAIGHLSSYSANIGHITAGLLESTNYSPTTGCRIDLDDGTISGTITFQQNTTGVSNITDAGDLITQNRTDLNYEDGADQTSTHTAYDTARVNGTAASTVKNNAYYGNHIYNNAGVLAYRDSVGTAQLDSTIISGGYIKANLLDVNSILISDNITGNIEFTSAGKITFDYSTNYIYGSGNTVHMYGGGNGYLALSYSYASLSGPTLNLSNNANILKFSENFLRITSVGDNEAVDLGGPVNRWAGVFASAFSASTTGGYYDKIDDLAALHKIQPDTKGKVQKFSLPEEVLDIELVKAELKKQNGDMLTDKDLDVMLRDEEDMGHFVGVNIMEMAFLIEGAVRQLDRENSATQYELLDWINDLEKRVTALEPQT